MGQVAGFRSCIIVARARLKWKANERKKRRLGMKRGANFFSPGTQNACTQFYVPRSQTRMENLQGQEQKLPKYICL